jgi:hypothetical protein
MACLTYNAADAQKLINEEKKNFGKYFKNFEEKQPNSKYRDLICDSDIKTKLDNAAKYIAKQPMFDFGLDKQRSAFKVGIKGILYKEILHLLNDVPDDVFSSIPAKNKTSKRSSTNVRRPSKVPDEDENSESSEKSDNEKSDGEDDNESVVSEKVSESKPTILGTAKSVVAGGLSTAAAAGAAVGKGSAIVVNKLGSLLGSALSVTKQLDVPLFYEKQIDIDNMNAELENISTHRKNEEYKLATMGLSQDVLKGLTDGFSNRITFKGKPFHQLLRNPDKTEYVDQVHAVFSNKKQINASKFKGRIKTLTANFFDDEGDLKNDVTPNLFAINVFNAYKVSKDETVAVEDTACLIVFSYIFIRYFIALNKGFTMDELYDMTNAPHGHIVLLMYLVLSKTQFVGSGYESFTSNHLVGLLTKLFRFKHDENGLKIDLKKNVMDTEVLNMFGKNFNCGSAFDKKSDFSAGNVNKWFAVFTRIAARLYSAEVSVDDKPMIEQVWNDANGIKEEPVSKEDTDIQATEEWITRDEF